MTKMPDRMFTTAKVRLLLERPLLRAIIDLVCSELDQVRGAAAKTTSLFAAEAQLIPGDRRCLQAETTSA